MSSCFKIKIPDGKTLDLYYSKEDKLSQHINMLNDIVFSHIINNSSFYNELKELNSDGQMSKNELQAELRELGCKYKSNNLYNYCISHWICFNETGNGKLNYEDRVKMFLDRCGTFLLKGCYRSSMVIDDDRRGKEIRYREIPVSNTSSEVENMFYSSDSMEGYSGQSNGECIISDNELVINTKNYNVDDAHGQQLKHKAKKRAKRQVDGDKIKMIYKQSDVIRPVLYMLTNADAYQNPPAGFDADEVERWKRQPFKNIHKEHLFNVRKKVFKGHDGYIDKDKPYVWKWAVVDTENRFEFNGNQYKIGNTLEQYRCDSDNRCEQDKILCYCQDGKYYFFDMKVNNINQYIIKI